MRSLVLAIALLAGCAPALVWSGRTPDRRHTIEVIRKDGLDFVHVDGARRAAFRGIAGWSIAITNDRIAFAARVDDRWVVVRDGRASRERWDGIGDVQLAADGRLVYVAQRGARWHVVVDDVVGAPHDSILAGTLRTAGKHVAYVAEDDARSRVIVDGFAHERFDGISQLVLDADGHHAYVGRRALEMFAVVDGKSSRAHERIARLHLGPRGHFAFAASSGSEKRIVIDGVPGPAVDEIRHIEFRDDGTRVAWIGRVESIDVLAIGDKPIAAWPANNNPKLAFRPSAVPGNTLGFAYVARVAGGEHVVVDDVAGPLYDEVRAPVWGPSGVAYAARRGGRWFIVDNTGERDAGDSVGDPVFAGERFAYAGRRNRSGYVAVDGKTFSYDLVFEDTVVFSSDGKRWGAVVGDLAREKLFIVIDGERRAPIDTHELYSMVASGSQTTLRDWTRAELDR